MRRRRAEGVEVGGGVPRGWHGAGGTDPFRTWWERAPGQSLLHVLPAPLAPTPRVANAPNRAQPAQPLCKPLVHTAREDHVRSVQDAQHEMAPWA
jgi:hypothetical protein